MFFYTKHKISQNEFVLGTNIQNEKQSTFFKLYENINILRKKFDQHTKGTNWRKTLPKSDTINSWWSLWKRKKSVRHKANGPTNRFSYDHRTVKPQNQEIQKFLPHLISRGECKTSGEKKSWKSLVALNGWKRGSS